MAVLGCGIDRDYPRTHASLAAEIAREGLIVSEYAPGVEPAPWRFPARNRIVAGSAFATVVVEARERSGALITADLALDEGREVLAVPGRDHLAALARHESPAAPRRRPSRAPPTCSRARRRPAAGAGAAGARTERSAPSTRSWATARSMSMNIVRRTDSPPAAAAAALASFSCSALSRTPRGSIGRVMRQTETSDPS